MTTTITRCAVPRNVTILYWKWNWYFPFSLSQTTPEDKGHQSRDRKRVSHAFAKYTHEMTHETLPLFPGARNFIRIA